MHHFINIKCLSLNEVTRRELESIVFSRFLISPEGKQLHKDLVDAILGHYSQTGPVCQESFLSSPHDFFFLII